MKKFVVLRDFYNFRRLIPQLGIAYRDDTDSLKLKQKRQTGYAPFASFINMNVLGNIMYITESLTIDL